MATVPPRTERRRARPGSVERPVNGRLYRGTWLLVGLPLLALAFSVARPTPLQRAFLPEFDGRATKQLADQLTTDYPNRFPGSLAAADWVRGAFSAPTRRCRGHQPGLRRGPWRNPARARRGHAADRVRHTRRNGGGQSRGGDRTTAPALGHPAPARRSRLPLFPLRAGAVH